MTAPAPSLRRRARVGVKGLLGERRKKVLLYRRARCCELVGIHRYSWPGWNGLDRRLVQLLDFERGGVFIEAGANDGYSQSNTYYLQRHLGWSGILVEPVPALAALCRRFRPGADVREVALCARRDDRSKLRLRVEDLTTAVERTDAMRPDGAAELIDVPCWTLAAVVRSAALDRVDLLSLDVEGFELDVLDGMDAAMPRPRHILVETTQPDAVTAALYDTHRPVTALSHHDYLYVAR